MWRLRWITGNSQRERRRCREAVSVRDNEGGIGGPRLLMMVRLAVGLVVEGDVGSGNDGVGMMEGY